MTNRERPPTTIRALAALAVLTLLAWALAANQEATFVVSSAGVEGPTTLAPGFAAITLQNESDLSVDIMVVDIGQGTPDDVVRQMQGIDAAYAAEGDADPVETLRAALDAYTFWGGTSAEPGAGSSFGVPLPAGRYAVIASGHDMAAEEPTPPTYATMTFEVSGEAAAPAPEPDVTVQLVDFAYALPSDLVPGVQTWDFVNRGEQVHVAAIMKLLPGKTMDDVRSFMESGFDGEDPAEDFAYVSLLSTGASNVLTLDLTPGTYLMVCWVPDYAVTGDGAPHYDHGMLLSFTVPR